MEPHLIYYIIIHKNLLSVITGAPMPNHQGAYYEESDIKMMSLIILMSDFFFRFVLLPFLASKTVGWKPVDANTKHRCQATDGC